MVVRKDRVRAIAVFKARSELSSADILARAEQMIAAVQALPIMQENLLKYEASFKTERPSGTLASELGLRETEFSVMILVEAATHEKIHETLTDPGYRKLLAGALEHITTREDFHFFPAEFVTMIDK
ncbi:hypothetical protein DFH08DRAFT_346647 [Mycena albidolilacea]|uniref:Uncharacterized protein n=1 Tax=Mycena albidolilacea TaxID=1033008 RepID=A0AAD6ZIC7_9AGAR|nr:hypothetical protein DFH08DRAFT_346647 [Mycena albidolilacea]